MVFSNLLLYVPGNCHVFVTSLHTWDFFTTCLLIHKFLAHFCQMFEKLKQRWKVNEVNLLLIIITFALGGSLCGYAGRKLLMLSELEKGPLWFILYVLLVTLLWPVCVLLISIPLGQFSFFKNYLTKVWGRMNGKTKKDENGAVFINLAIFASGAGSNAQQIINYFTASSNIKIALVVCNKPDAGVLTIAQEAGVPSLIIEKERFFNGDNFLPVLEKHKINFIVLAGFLWKMPPAMIKTYPNKIINIHPALLPKYGGKGMYGNHVHQSVIKAKDTESGITIHFVDELYDHGEIIFQAKCIVHENDTAETLAQKIHLLEHANFPRVIAGVLEKQNRS
jgi:formyltetrahydrofolate-dependent phosphoribosylglycinamide formyltransferase